MPSTVGKRDLAGIPFSIGEWLVEPSLNRLSKGDTNIQLELKVMDVLVCLAERAGEVVPRQEIVDSVWATEFISDNTLTHAVTELRNALGDDARDPSFIETIHRRGYRLIAAVEPTVLHEPGESKVARFPVRERAGSPDVERSPYPGLAAFTEADAEFFFGREAEVGQMWRKLTSRKLLAVIGPSGVGKSSFLRAGLIPAKPDGWGVVLCEPGEAPFPALARALVPEFAGDVEAMAQLVDIRDGDRAIAMVSRWRDRYGQALFIVDQFEELFTQNPPEAQTGFAEVLRKLVDNSDVHILLSMRDDFLFKCHGHKPLRPVFDALMPLEQPDVEALSRALSEPARRLGFAYEDDGLPGEMIAGVEGERGALPLLAFAVARLWDKRDSERKLLTNQAYSEIGGVGGALARHAEATLKAIGEERVPIVREIFRNLVTAEGTRAVRGSDDLLTVFPESQQAESEQVLGRLIDARLLTSFEEEDVEGDGRRRVEVVHETLLSSWPRLVRWQTQDADAAQLRDQLRQAARTWDEQGRADDTLWTGAAYREFASWRERYPGGLTEIEEAFAVAMTSLAKRRRRRRRIAVSVIFIALLAGLAVVGTFWRRSVIETRRAEASKLLALAEVQLGGDPTVALAYATSSLELADTRDARLFTMRALWAGPPALVLSPRGVGSGMSYAIPTFSPDGRWLAAAGMANEDVLVFNEAGGPPIILGGHAVSANAPIQCAWSRDGHLVTGHGSEHRARMWAIPDARLLREIDFDGSAWWQVGEDHLFAEATTTDQVTGGRVFRLRSWGLPGWEQKELGEVDPKGSAWSCFDPGGEAWVYARGDTVYARPLPVQLGGGDRQIARHSSSDVRVQPWRRPEGYFSSDGVGEVVIWRTSADGTSARGRRLRKPETANVRLEPEPTGRWAVDADVQRREGKLLLWDLDGLPGSRPVELRRAGSWYFSFIDFCPGNRWVVVERSNLGGEISFWPLQGIRGAVVEGYDTFARRPVEFSADGRYLVTYWGQDRVRLWPMPAAEEYEKIDLMLPRSSTRTGLAIDPTGPHVLSTGYGHDIYLLSVNGETPRRLEGFPATDVIWFGGDISPNGKLVAAASAISETSPTLRVWNVETGEAQAFALPEIPNGVSSENIKKGYFVWHLAFHDESTLYTGGAIGLLRWDLENGSSERLIEAPPGGMVGMVMSSDRTTMLSFESAASRTRDKVDLHDLRSGMRRPLDIPGQSRMLAIDPGGRIWATGEDDGLLWVGLVDGGQPHVLAGHKGPITSVAISPDGKWIASSGEDETLRLWPMPDLDKPPLHALPRGELIAKLKTLTNLRVVRDEESSTGWKVEVGPFPGWETVPTW